MSKLRMTSSSKDKIDANDFCVKEKAIEFLSERSKCAEKSERYVNYVFEKCKNDTAPFSTGSKARKVK